MNWQDSDLLFEDQTLEGACQLETMSTTSTNNDENDRKNSIQLKKFADPAKDTHRKSLMNIVAHFSKLLEKNQREEIDKTVMSEDCLVFVMNFDTMSNLRCSSKIGEGISKVYPNVKMIERQVLENYVDVQKNTVIQVCKCLLWQEEENSKEGSIIERITCDLFSIRDHKIFKYRVFFCTVAPNQANNPFIMTNKEKMLARVKEINYVLCGLPNIERVANLLDDQTEYKICSWDQQNCYTANKYELKGTFNKLQETMQITKIVPYDFTVNGCKVQANYVYYLQDKINKEHYVWLTNCIYLFDQDLKISKILQMGELISEEEAVVPFEAFCMNDLLKGVQFNVDRKVPNSDLFYDNKMKFDCTYCSFGDNIDCLDMGKVEKFDKLLNRIDPSKFNSSDWRKIVDLYTEEHGSGYDTCFYLGCEEYGAGSDGKERDRNIIRLNKISSENGKVCKVVNFYITIYEPVPSLFDDLKFSAQHIIAANNFY